MQSIIKCMCNKYTKSNVFRLYSYVPSRLRIGPDRFNHLQSSINVEIRHKWSRMMSVRTWQLKFITTSTFVICFNHLNTGTANQKPKLNTAGSVLHHIGRVVQIAKKILNGSTRFEKWFKLSVFPCRPLKIVLFYLLYIKVLIFRNLKLPYHTFT